MKVVFLNAVSALSWCHDSDGFVAAAFILAWVEKRGWKSEGKRSGVQIPHTLHHWRTPSVRAGHNKDALIGKGWHARPLIWHREMKSLKVTGRRMLAHAAQLQPNLLCRTSPFQFLCSQIVHFYFDSASFFLLRKKWLRWKISLFCWLKQSAGKIHIHLYIQRYFIKVSLTKHPDHIKTFDEIPDVYGGWLGPQQNFFLNLTFFSEFWLQIWEKKCQLIFKMHLIF